MVALLRIDETTGLQEHDTNAALPARLNGNLITLLGASYASGIKAKATVANVLGDLESNVIDVAFTNASGGALNGIDSGLTTVDGKKIFLYTYSGDNNLVVARAGVLVSGNYVADPAGAIAFVAYLETNGSTGGSPSDQNASDANLWVVEFLNLQHNLNGLSPNDFVTLTGKLNVTVTNPINFSLEGAPSGQSVFMMFGDGTPGVDENGDPDPDEVAIVVTAPNAGGTVNTGQGGGGTTLGNFNQMVDPNEGLVFSFVKGANEDFTVPNLDAGEAGEEGNIDFESFFEATSASFDVVQLQPTKKATLQVSAHQAKLNTHGTASTSDDTPWEKDDYLDHQLDNNLVNITGIVITRTVMVKKVAHLYTVTYGEGGSVSGTLKIGNAAANPITASQLAALDLTVTFPGMDVRIQGIIAKDNIKYTTDSDHDRAIINNVGHATNATYNSAFDIGGFKIVSGGIVTNPLGDIDFYDDGPNISISLVANAEVRVDESIGQNGAPETEPAGTLGRVTVAAAVLFSQTQGYGTDGAAASSPSVYSLRLTGTAPDSGLDDSATGLSVLLYVDGNDIVGRTSAGADPVFRIAIDATSGAVTLTQYRAMLHGNAADHDESATPLSIASGLVAAVRTVTDRDNDSASDDADIGPAMKFEDDGPSVTIDLRAGAEVRVDESIGQNGVPETEPAGTLGQVTVTAAVLYSELASFGNDGAAASGSSVYSLRLTGTAPDSGLDDTATGLSVLLYVDGNDIVGRTSAGAAPVFRIAIDASSGAVTLTQYRAMKHPSASDPDEAASPLSIAAGLVAAVRTVKDKDNDTASNDADIGPAMKFEDDGPGIGPISDGLVDFAVGSTVTKTLAGAVGSDGKTAPYTLTDWTGDDGSNIIVSGVTLRAVANSATAPTSVTYWANTSGNGIFGDAGDTAFYRLELSQTAFSGAGSYTFTVLQPPPVVENNFGFADQPAGQNLFGIIATDKDNVVGTPPNATLPDGGLLFFNAGVVVDASGQYTNASSTVNTSKGGGEVSIGYGANNYTADNQDAFFVFADNPNSAAVGGLGLTQTTADVANTVRFNGTNEVSSAAVEIVKIVGSTESGVTIRAFNLNPGNVANALNVDTNGEAQSFLIDPLAFGGAGNTATSCNIDGVKVWSSTTLLDSTTLVFSAKDLTGDGDFNDPDEITVNSGNVTVTENADGSFRVDGLDTDKNYTIRYDSKTPHDMAKVEYETGSYNIGGFNLIQSVPTPDQIFDFTAMVIDGDGDTDGGDASASWSVGIDGTGIHDNGAVSGVTPALAATLSLRTPDMIGESDWSRGDVRLDVSSGQQMIIPTYRNLDYFL